MEHEHETKVFLFSKTEIAMVKGGTEYGNLEENSGSTSSALSSDANSLQHAPC